MVQPVSHYPGNMEVWVQSQGSPCEIFGRQSATEMGFLGVFAKLQKVTNSFAMSVYPRGTTRLPLNRFSQNLIFEYISKIRRENFGFIII
jgi:hypothetical protein